MAAGRGCLPWVTPLSKMLFFTLARNAQNTPFFCTFVAALGKQLRQLSQSSLLVFLDNRFVCFYSFSAILCVRHSEQAREMAAYLFSKSKNHHMTCHASSPPETGKGQWPPTSQPRGQLHAEPGARGAGPQALPTASSLVWRPWRSQAGSNRGKVSGIVREKSTVGHGKRGDFLWLGGGRPSQASTAPW